MNRCGHVPTDENMLIDVAKHCIGLNYKKPYTRHGKQFYRPYRNQYYTLRKDKLWEALYRMGYASRWPLNTRGYYEYWLTRVGLDWLGEKLNIHIYDEGE